MDDAKEAIGALDAGTKSLDLGEADFFTQLDEDVAVVEGDAKVEANIVHGFNSHRSTIVPWLRRTSIEEHTRGLKKDEMHASFNIPKTTKSEPELFLILEGHRRDLYKGTQLVLRRPGLYTDLALVAGVKPLLYYGYGQSTGVRP